MSFNNTLLYKNINFWKLRTFAGVYISPPWSGFPHCKCIAKMIFEAYTADPRPIPMIKVPCIHSTRQPCANYREVFLVSQLLFLWVDRFRKAPCLTLSQDMSQQENKAVYWIQKFSGLSGNPDLFSIPGKEGKT